ncbi:ABC transporter ATP-binding protein [Acidianus sulfidivorans]|nr:ABC transporter ATP-binding protein [Acidianus sulfidivorans]
MQPIREFESDLTLDKKFGKLEIKLFNDNLVLDDGKNKMIYDLSKLKNVKLNEGFGINAITAEYDGKDVELFFFTNKVKTKIVELYEILSSITSKSYLSIEKRSKNTNNQSVIRWLLSLISPYKLRLGLGIIFSLLLVIASLTPPYLLKIFINNVLSVKGNYGLFDELIIILIAVYSAIVGITILQNYLLNYLGQKLSNELRVRIYEHVNKLSLGFIENFQSGRILSRITTDVGNTQWFLIWGIPTLLTNLVTIIGIGVIVFLMNPFLGIFSILPIPAIIIGTVIYRRKSRLKFHKVWRRSADITSLLTDTIPSSIIVRSYANEDYENFRLKKLTQDLFSSQMEVVKLNVSWWPLLGFILSLTTVIIWLVGGKDVINGTLELGTLVAFITYLSMFYQPIQNLTNIIPFMQQAFTSAERILEIINSEPDIKEKDNPKKIDMKGEITFDRVWFGYDPLAPVIKDVSLKIKPGEKIGIVGESGSGKTTLIKLLLRFYDPLAGKITIDGIDLKDLDLKNYRSQIGVVHADPTLLYGTVAYNISYGKQDAKPEEIIAAALMSKAHDFIMNLPLAYDTHLGERGNRLSSGQKQMIAIARALIKEPKLLIMDEPTANVDSITEREIIKSLEEAMKGRTTIIISHRFSILKYVDRIIVMDKGKIVEEGKMDELLSKNGKFYEIFHGVGNGSREVYKETEYNQ